MHPVFFHAEEILSKGHKANIRTKVNDVVQIHHTVHSCGGMGRSELLLDDPASARSFKPVGVEHLIITVGRELTELEDSSIWEGSYVRGLAVIILCLENFNSGLAFGRITPHMSCRYSWTIFFSSHGLHIFSDNRDRTCSKLGDHTQQGVIVINIERLHVGTYDKAAGDDYWGLNQVHSKRAIPGFQSLLQLGTEEVLSRPVVTNEKTEKGPITEPKSYLMSIDFNSGFVRMLVSPDTRL